MCKVIEVDFMKSNAALMLEKYTKEEQELIEAYKGLKEFYKEVNKEEWIFNDGQVNVIINN